MTAFSYRAATLEGRIVAGRMEADSAEIVRRQLRRQDLFAVDVQTTADGAERRWRVPRLKRARPRRDLARRVAREVGGLLDAGFSLDRALALLADMLVEEHPADGTVMLAVRERVRQGDDLSDALAAHPAAFSPFFISLVRAGEIGGKLEEVLGGLAEHLDRRAELESRITSALIYPSIMTVVGGAAVLVLLLFVFPRFVGLLEDADQGLPLSARIVVTASDVVTTFWWLLAALVVGAVVVLTRLRRTEDGRRRIDLRLLHLPVWGGLQREILTARFARTLTTLLDGGVPFLAAVRVSAETIGNAAMRGLFEQVRERVEKGRPMSDALAQSVLVPRVATQMIRLGEESGELTRMLRKVAEVHETRIRTTTQRLVALLEPAIILVFGLAVGLVALAMIQTILAVNEVPL